MAIRDDHQTLPVAPRNVPARCYVSWAGQLAVWERHGDNVLITGIDPGRGGRAFYPHVDMLTEDILVYVTVPEPPTRTD